MQLIPFLVILFAWWLATAVLYIVPPIMLPSPQAVAGVFVNSSGGAIVESIAGSLSRFAYGLAFGGLLAAPLGIALAVRPLLADALLPFIKFFQAIAGVTWIPLAVLWFGISTEAAVFIISNTTFFIILYAVLTGVRTINPILTQSVKTLGGGFTQVVGHVLIPGSMPHLLTGLRLAIGYGWRALIAAEIVAAGRGLGVMIWEGQQQLNTAVIFAALLLIGGISFAMDRLILRPLERRTIQRWGLSTQES